MPLQANWRYFFASTGFIEARRFILFQLSLIFSSSPNIRQPKSAFNYPTNLVRFHFLQWMQCINRINTTIYCVYLPAKNLFINRFISTLLLANEHYDQLRSPNIPSASHDSYTQTDCIFLRTYRLYWYQHIDPFFYKRFHYWLYRSSPVQISEEICKPAFTMPVRHFGT